MILSERKWIITAKSQLLYAKHGHDLMQHLRIMDEGVDCVEQYIGEY